MSFSLFFAYFLTEIRVNIGISPVLDFVSFLFFLYIPRMLGHKLRPDKGSSDEVRSSKARSGQVSKVRSDEVRSGNVRSGQVWSCNVRSGHI